jgi:hypothetical protein
LYLLVDQAGSWLGPVQLQSGATLSNSQCTINAGSSSVQLTGNTMTLTFNITFKPAFSGLQQLWTYAVGSGGGSASAQSGTWNVAGWVSLKEYIHLGSRTIATENH